MWKSDHVSSLHPRFLQSMVDKNLSICDVSHLDFCRMHQTEVGIILQETSKVSFSFQRMPAQVVLVSILRHHCRMHLVWSHKFLRSGFLHRSHFSWRQACKAGTWCPVHMITSTWLPVELQNLAPVSWKSASSMPMVSCPKFGHVSKGNLVILSSCLRTARASQRILVTPPKSAASMTLRTTVWYPTCFRVSMQRFPYCRCVENALTCSRRTIMGLICLHLRIAEGSKHPWSESNPGPDYAPLQEEDMEHWSSWYAHPNCIWLEAMHHCQYQARMITSLSSFSKLTSRGMWEASMSKVSWFMA